MDDPVALVRKLLKEGKLCNLATASLDGKPENADIRYAEDAEFNLYFETLRTHRKYKNLKDNPQAAIAVTQDPHTVQMDGSVTELIGDAAEKAKQVIITKKGRGSDFYQDENICWFKFTPHWIRVRMSADWPPHYEIIRNEKNHHNQTR